LLSKSGYYLVTAKGDISGSVPVTFETEAKLMVWIVPLAEGTWEIDGFMLKS